ncbi:hypothetical protein [Streptomyces spectabilis]|uniref:Lipoprotein n=1 Tax=Streptomyces spectabilis TaxID=68270 RepID=A0A7W8B328_STRST|nr:hypothetical protein [Streptomyces spectabilis]MBB5109428.1 hypothetical protein [Streptomyces spectabilis]MCI3907780.1 hypothetical protein [Streptomyces spectabilis]GGV53601.1 hypothetical protein GCM10010245_84720 [Streptomyces spectabilis]
MGRSTAIPAVLLPLLLVTACSDSDDSTPRSAGSPPKTTSTASASPAPGSSAGSVEKSLRLPAHPMYLVPVRDGVGTEDLPDFTPGKEVYTVHIKCSGASSVKLIKQGRPKDNPTSINCDTPVTVGRIYADPVKQKLAIQADGEARWTAAIVDGQRAL